MIEFLKGFPVPVIPKHLIPQLVDKSIFSLSVKITPVEFAVSYQILVKDDQNTLIKQQNVKFVETRFN